MAFYDKFPYTNFQELNLDKIVQKIGDIDRAETATAESAAAAKASETAAAESEANAAASEAAAESAKNTAVLTSEGITAVAEQINTNTERLNNLIVDGTPTEGNTELIDIRVGADGVTYPTAGDAVRGQYLANRTDDAFNAQEIRQTQKPEGKIYIGFERGYLVTGGGTIHDGSTAGVIARRLKSRKLTLFDLPAGTIVTSSGLTQFRIYWASDANDTYLADSEWVQAYQIEDTVNGQSFDHFYISINMADDVTVANIDTLYDSFDITLNYIGGTEVTVIGGVFAWVANSVLHVQVARNTRILFGNKVAAFDNALESTLTVPGNSAYYIKVNESAPYFELVRFASLTKNDAYLGTAYQGFVYSNADHVYCNILPLMRIYERQGVPFYLNEDRLGFSILPTYLVNTTGTYYKFKKTYRFYNVTGSSIHLNDPHGNSYPMLGGAVTANNTNIDNMKILMIGDSLTNRGWLQRQIRSRNASVQFLGTYQTGIGTGITDYMCEAYPGASSTDMITAGGTHSHINGNYTQYITNYLNGVAPDLVTIEFGLNESDAEAYRTNIQTLINQIKAYDTANNHVTKIYVLTPIERVKSENVGDNYNWPRSNRELPARKVILEASALTDCTLIPAHAIFDDRYDYVWSTVSYGYGKTIDAIDDFVHPSEDVGFPKLADMIYNYLGI